MGVGVMSASRPYSGFAVLAVLLLGFAAPAWAQEAPGVRCTVSLGFASQAEGPTHPKFRGIPIPGPFRSVRMQEQRSYNLRMGEQGKYALPGGREIHMLPVQVLNQQLHMQFEMPGVVNTRLRLRNGKRMVVGGVPFKDGQLIIQVEPEFEAGQSAQGGIAAERAR